MMDRAHLEVDRLERAEGVLDLGQALVGEHGRRGVQRLGRHAGAQHIETVECRLLGDSTLVAGEAEAVVVDGEREVLGHLASPQHGADLEADRRLAVEWAALALDRGLDPREIPLGGGQEILPLAAALDRQIGIPADNQPLAGIVGRGDLGHVPLVEQRQLQRPALGRQRLNRRCAQGGDPAAAAGGGSVSKAARIRRPARASPAGLRSDAIRALVIIPRSPTRTTRWRPKRRLSLATWAASVLGSPVSPSNTSTAIGQPSAAHNSPKTICSLPALPSRL
jgi:hypothetical protein